MDSDLRSKQEALTELRKTVEEMRQSTGGQAGGRSPDFLDAVSTLVERYYADGETLVLN